MQDRIPAHGICSILEFGARSAHHCITFVSLLSCRLASLSFRLFFPFWIAHVSDLLGMDPSTGLSTGLSARPSPGRTSSCRWTIPRLSVSRSLPSSLGPCLTVYLLPELSSVPPTAILAVASVYPRLTCLPFGLAVVLLAGLTGAILLSLFVFLPNWDYYALPGH